MKKIALVVCMLSSVSSVYAMHSGDGYDSVMEAKKNTPIPHCNFGFRVPPCPDCAKARYANNENSTKDSSPVSLKKSQEMPRFP